MQRIVEKVANSTTILKGGSKMWCGFSKPKAERDRGSHAALVRRAVRSLNPDRKGELEAEYGSGSTWLADYKFSSASVAPDGLDHAKLVEFDPLVPGGVHPGSDVGAMSECLQMGLDDVREAIKAQRRH